MSNHLGTRWINDADRPFDQAPLDANRWLYVHQDELIGATRAAAVALVLEEGLLPEALSHRDVSTQTGSPSRDSVRLAIGDDDKVRSAQSAA